MIEVGLQEAVEVLGGGVDAAVKAFVGVRTGQALADSTLTMSTALPLVLNLGARGAVVSPS